MGANCYICGEGGMTSKDYSGDGIFVCKECERFSSAANMLLNVPLHDIEALCSYVETDVENGVQTNTHEWLTTTRKVRKWLSGNGSR